MTPILRPADAEHPPGLYVARQSVNAWPVVLEFSEHGIWLQRHFGGLMCAAVDPVGKTFGPLPQEEI